MLSALVSRLRLTQPDGVVWGSARILSAFLKAGLNAPQGKPMIPNSPGAGKRDALAREKISYVRQMLGELRGVAATEGADMLCYLIEMAAVEAGDILSGKRQLSFSNVEGNEATGMPVKSSGKVQF
jgi:hypothetical protein